MATKNKRKIATFSFAAVPFSNNKMTSRKNKTKKKWYVYQRETERKKKRWDKMELHAMVKYWVGVFEKGDVWNDARSNEKENQSKTTTKRTFTPFYCFGGFSFACWIRISFTFLEPQTTCCSECWAFYMQAKFHSVRTFFYPFCRLSFTAATAAAAVGILISVFLPLSAKEFMVYMYACMSINQTGWNSFLPSRPAFRLSLVLNKKSGAL